jgi:Domain of unknown function (DUF4340)
LQGIGDDPKMKIRKEAVILGVVIIALSLYLVFNKRDRNLYDLPDLKSIAVSEISKITLDSSEGTVLLTQKAGDWVVNEAAYPGDTATIKRVVEIIANLKLTTLISESKNYARYDLDPEHKMTIKAWNNATLVREFDMGKAASGHRHTFVKLEGDHRVYHAQENFRNRLQGKADKFRDKSVMSFEPDQIQEIQLSTMDAQSAFIKETSPEASEQTPVEGETAALQEAKPVWKNEAGVVVKDNKLTKLMGDFSALKCSGFVEDATKSDFKDPIATITFKGVEAYTLQIFERLDKGLSKHPAISSQNDYVFYIPKWQADQLTKALTDIVPLEE